LSPGNNPASRGTATNGRGTRRRIPQFAVAASVTCPITHYGPLRYNIYDYLIALRSIHAGSLVFYRSSAVIYIAILESLLNLYANASLDLF
jgi:hypothetical protein